MSFKKTPVKPHPTASDLENFIGGANYSDDLQPLKGASSKSKTNLRGKKEKEDELKKETNSHRYNILISPSYLRKIQVLRGRGVNIQAKVRNYLYPLIDKLIDETEE